MMTLCFEWPRIYQRGDNRTKGDPNDLRPLWAVGGAIACRLSEFLPYTVEPAGWKGQLTHEAVEFRVEGRLDDAEAAVYKAALKAAGKTYGHNVTDAVGIGLYFVGRFDKQRVIHRDPEAVVAPRRAKRSP
jgi:hypothetical protein